MEKQYYATAVLQVYVLPPSLIPLDQLQDIVLSSGGHVSVVLASTVTREFNEFCFTYIPEISFDLAFGCVTRVEGVFARKHNVTLPVDSLTVEYEDHDREVVQVTMGPASARIPGSVFRNPGSRASAKPKGRVKAQTPSAATRNAPVFSTFDSFPAKRETGDESVQLPLQAWLKRVASELPSNSIRREPSTSSIGSVSVSRSSESSTSTNMEGRELAQQVATDNAGFLSDLPGVFETEGQRDRRAVPAPHSPDSTDASEGLHCREPTVASLVRPS